MKVLKYIIVIGVILLFVSTNPSADEHTEKAVDIFQEQTKQDLGDWGVLNSLRNWGTDKIGKGSISVTNRRNFVLFSMCDVAVLGEPAFTTLGCVGQVWVVDKESD